MLPSATAKKLTIAIVGNDGPVSAMSYALPENLTHKRYVHYTTNWNMSNKASGTYMFLMVADEELVASYALEITDQ